MDKLSKVKELKKNKKVRFSSGGYLYDIFWSFTNDGWMINVYDESDVIFDCDGLLISELAMDGGLCTGSAKDAINMFFGS